MRFSQLLKALIVSTFTTAKAGGPALEHFSFETLHVSTHHSDEKHGFRQNPRRIAAVAAFASTEHFYFENALIVAAVLLESRLDFRLRGNDESKNRHFFQTTETCIET